MTPETSTAFFGQVLAILLLPFSFLVVVQIVRRWLS